MLPALLAFIHLPAADQPINLDGTLCHPRRLLVKAPQPVMQTVRKQVSFVGSRFAEIGWTVVEAPAGRLQETRRRLRAVPGVVAVELDRAAKPAYDPNDPKWPDQWHLRTIKANLAWDLSFGGPTVVAVIDTGVEVTHPDLQANVWVNDDEIPGNSIDDDGNGYVDDVNGYDFAYGDADPNDVFGHGTPCSGLVGAVQDNSIGVTGVAPHARIMCLKTAIDSGYLYDSANVPAYLYAAHNGARVMSMSFYSDRVSQAERDAIDFCWSQGVLPVAAAANESSVYPFYPAAYENTLSVAAVTGDLSKAGFSNYGSWVDVAAPGVSLTTIKTGGDYTGGFGGTSGACPHVAGVAALLIGAKPSATAEEVRAAIEDTATPLSQAPYGEFCNYGLVNASAALNALLTSPAPARSNVVRYITPLAVSSSFGQKVVARVYGRGFQAPAQAEAKVGGLDVAVLRRSRDWMDIRLLAERGPITINVGGHITTIDRPVIKGLLYSMIEASAPGASVQGGFVETIKNDGVVLKATRRGDGFIYVQATFRKVQTGAITMLLNITRRYTDATAGTEKIYLYDWSTGSFPYGQYVEMSSLAVPTSMTLTSMPISQMDRFIDPEGTVYFLIRTSDDLDAGAGLEIDSLHLQQTN